MESKVLVSAKLCQQIVVVVAHKVAQGSEVVCEPLRIALIGDYCAACGNRPGVLDAVLQEIEMLAGEEQRVVEVDAPQGCVGFRGIILLPFCAVENLGTPEAVTLLGINQGICLFYDAADIVLSETCLNVGQCQLHFHRRIALAADYLLQFRHHHFPYYVGHLVCFVECALEVP